MSLLSSNTINQLIKSVEYAQTKQNVIAQNISNATTPGYKEQTVTFKQTLNEHQHRLKANMTNQKHIPFSTQVGSPFIITKSNTMSYNHNGNSVDVDKQMAMMAENQLHYYALVDRLSGKFSSLQSVIRGGQ
ncbi:flagellar basal body rod protein FlgB [Aureibacillus halotolerans]|uniref:Flagellar basal body rod protein FlgB n=1 Tax=Aureibacillus halotolerans TaxID=1508390 RepID=A0A4R6U2Q8_9BACI|nr:flagellar basal body rod protein FlgB [Aureibacillus halotolerans]TDQ39642.1 flagellar basal-body rod protein FlgB [Aureibacillus halotolerans]